jgi:hypothetical protein
MQAGTDLLTAGIAQTLAPPASSGSHNGWGYAQYHQRAVAVQSQLYSRKRQGDGVRSIECASNVSDVDVPR